MSASAFQGAQSFFITHVLFCFVFLTLHLPGWTPESPIISPFIPHNFLPSQIAPYSEIYQTILAMKMCYSTDFPSSVSLPYSLLCGTFLSSYSSVVYLPLCSFCCSTPLCSMLCVGNKVKWQDFWSPKSHFHFATHTQNRAIQTGTTTTKKTSYLYTILLHSDPLWTLSVGGCLQLP